MSYLHIIYRSIYQQVIYLRVVFLSFYGDNRNTKQLPLGLFVSMGLYDREERMMDVNISRLIYFSESECLHAYLGII